MRKQHKIEGAIEDGISVADEILKNAERNGSFGSDSVENREVLKKNLGLTETPFVKQHDKRKVGSGGSWEANRQGQHLRAHVIPKVKMRDQESLGFFWAPVRCYSKQGAGTGLCYDAGTRNSSGRDFRRSFLKFLSAGLEFKLKLRPIARRKCSLDFAS